MSANRVARPQSRRGILTAALAGAAASAGTLGGHVVLAAVAEPDPIFAAITRERAAFAAWCKTSEAFSDAEQAFQASGFKRSPQVQVGEFVRFQRRTAPGVYEAVPEHEQRPEPVYLGSHDAIDKNCGWRAGEVLPAAEEARRQRLHAELNADAVAIKAAKAPLEEADRVSDMAFAAWKAEAAKLMAVAPSSVPGLLALIDRFEVHTEGCLIDTDEDGLTVLLVHVRRLLTEAQA